MATKPTSLPEWASSGVIVEPAAGKKALGWTTERPAYTFFNWLFNLIYQWIQYLNEPVGTGSGAGFSATGGNSNGPGLSGKGGGDYGRGVFGEGGDVGGVGGWFAGKGTGCGAGFESEEGPSAYFTGNATRGSIQIEPRSGHPSNPQNGDFWIIGNTLYVRLDGATKAFTGV